MQQALSRRQSIPLLDHDIFRANLLYDCWQGWHLGMLVRHLIGCITDILKSGEVIRGIKENAKRAPWRNNSVGMLRLCPQYSSLLGAWAPAPDKFQGFIDGRELLSSMWQQMWRLYQ